MQSNIFKLTAASALGLLILGTPSFAMELTDWDTDANGSIGQDEFNTGFGQNQAFSSWDGNGDAGLDETELGAGFGDREIGAFSEGDADSDGLLNNDEFNDGIYNNYDVDGSGAIEEPEFGDIGDDMGDGGLFDI